MEAKTVSLQERIERLLKVPAEAVAELDVATEAFAGVTAARLTEQRVVELPAEVVVAVDEPEEHEGSQSQIPMSRCHEDSDSVSECSAFGDHDFARLQPLDDNTGT